MTDIRQEIVDALTCNEGEIYPLKFNNNTIEIQTLHHGGNLILLISMYLNEDKVTVNNKDFYFDYEVSNNKNEMVCYFNINNGVFISPINLNELLFSKLNKNSNLVLNVNIISTESNKLILKLEHSCNGSSNEREFANKFMTDILEVYKNSITTPPTSNEFLKNKLTNFREHFTKDKINGLIFSKNDGLYNYSIEKFKSLVPNNVEEFFNLKNGDIYPIPYSDGNYPSGFNTIHDLSWNFKSVSCFGIIEDNSTTFVITMYSNDISNDYLNSIITQGSLQLYFDDFEDYKLLYFTLLKIDFNTQEGSIFTKSLVPVIFTNKTKNFNPNTNSLNIAFNIVDSDSDQVLFTKNFLPVKDPKYSKKLLNEVYSYINEPKTIKDISNNLINDKYQEFIKDNSLLEDYEKFKECLLLPLHSMERDTTKNMFSKIATCKENSKFPLTFMGNSFEVYTNISDGKLSIYWIGFKKNNEYSTNDIKELKKESRFITHKVIGNYLFLFVLSKSITIGFYADLKEFSNEQIQTINSCDLTIFSVNPYNSILEFKLEIPFVPKYQINSNYLERFFNDVKSIIPNNVVFGIDNLDDCKEKANQYMYELSKRGKNNDTGLFVTYSPANTENKFKKEKAIKLNIDRSNKHYNFLAKMQTLFNNYEFKKYLPDIIREQNKEFSNHSGCYKPAVLIHPIIMTTIRSLARNFLTENNLKCDDYSLFNTYMYLTAIWCVDTDGSTQISEKHTVGSYEAYLSKHIPNFSEEKKSLINTIEPLSYDFSLLYVYTLRQKINTFNKDLGNELLKVDHDWHLDLSLFAEKGFHSLFIDVRNLDTSFFTSVNIQYVGFYICKSSEYKLVIQLFDDQGKYTISDFLINESATENLEHNDENNVNKDELKFSYRFISLLLYVLSENAEKEQIQSQPKQRHGKIKKVLGEIEITDKPTLAIIGNQTGQRIADAYNRKEKAEKEVSENKELKEYSPKRPHIRKAHYHQFWKGSRKEGEDGKPRHLVTHFIETTFVNM